MDFLTIFYFLFEGKQRSKLSEDVLVDLGECSPCGYIVQLRAESCKPLLRCVSPQRVQISTLAADRHRVQTH